MKAVYYFDIKKSIAPAKEFFTQYGLNLSKDHKDSVMAQIRARINFTLGRNGQAVPPIAKTLRNYSFFEIMCQDGKTLIRIFYFCHNEEKLVLLNALSKPARYEKGQKKRIVKIIDKELNITEQYRQNFIQNPNHYEVYK